MDWLRRQTKQQAAICIDGDRVHAAQVIRNREGPPSVRLCRSEAAGDHPTAALQRMAQALQSFDCIAVMPRQHFRLLLVEKPAVPAEELREAVRWRLAGVIDYPPEQAVVDTLPVAVDLAGGDHPTSVYAVAAERTRIAALTEQFRRSDLGLVAIDVADLAMRNLAALFAEPGAGTALAWFDARGSGIVFVAGSELCIVRHLEPTAREVQAALAARDTAGLERVELGLQRALDHFERNFTAVPINRLLVAPFAAATALAEYLNGTLNVAVQPAQLERVLDLASAPNLRDPVQASELLVSLGAALRVQ